MSGAPGGGLQLRKSTASNRIVTTFGRDNFEPVRSPDLLPQRFQNWRNRRFRPGFTVAAARATVCKTAKFPLVGSRDRLAGNLAGASPYLSHPTHRLPVKIIDNVPINQCLAALGSARGVMPPKHRHDPIGTSPHDPVGTSQPLNPLSDQRFIKLLSHTLNPILTTTFLGTHHP